MKLDEKRFLETAIISNVQGLLNSDWFVGHIPNYEEITNHSKNLALEMLKQRNEIFGLKDKIVKVKNTIPYINFEEIISIFNSVCIELPNASKLTIEREKAIIKILENYSLEDIGIVFKNTSESDYLCGKKVEWKADIDWILTPKNFVKILENKYKNIENGKQPGAEQTTYKNRNR